MQSILQKLDDIERKLATPYRGGANLDPRKTVVKEFFEELQDCLHKNGTHNWFFQDTIPKSVVLACMNKFVQDIFSKECPSSMTREDVIEKIPMRMSNVIWSLVPEDFDPKSDWGSKGELGNIPIVPAVMEYDSYNESFANVGVYSTHFTKIFADDKATATKQWAQYAAAGRISNHNGIWWAKSEEGTCLGILCYGGTYRERDEDSAPAAPPYAVPPAMEEKEELAPASASPSAKARPRGAPTPARHPPPRAADDLPQVRLTDIVVPNDIELFEPNSP